MAIDQKEAAETGVFQPAEHFDNGRDESLRLERNGSRPAVRMAEGTPKGQAGENDYSSDLGDRVTEFHRVASVHPCPQVRTVLFRGSDGQQA
jgi:hypothetical protein